MLPIVRKPNNFNRADSKGKIVIPRLITYEVTEDMLTKLWYPNLQHISIKLITSKRSAVTV